MGYSRAGFEVVGVDIEPQPRYPFEFHQADALEYVRLYGAEFDLIHTSPPCQYYSVTYSLSNKKHTGLIPETRQALIDTGKPYVIENVVGSPLINPLLLCGTMFNLHVIRHRLFECFPVIWFPPFTCNHIGFATGTRSHKKTTKCPSLTDGANYITVVGNDYLKAEGEKAMGINWMTKAGLSQAIPPAYTEWIGQQFLNFFLSHHAA
jgi:DNA (cytosine-5)-methyltransferase 1